MKTTMILTGRVHGPVSDQPYYCVNCPDAPAHLRTLFLTPSQMRSAKTGDRVRLEYHVSASTGLWIVAEILAS